MKFTKAKYHKRYIHLNLDSCELELDGDSDRNIEGIRITSIESYTAHSEEFGDSEKIGLVFIDEDKPSDAPMQFSAGRNTNRMHCLLLQLSNMKTFGNLSLSVLKKGEILNVIIYQEGKSVDWGTKYTKAEVRTDAITQGLINTINARLDQEHKLNPSLGQEAGSEPKDDKIATDHRPGRDTEKSSKVQQYPLTPADEEDEDDPF